MPVSAHTVPNLWDDKVAAKLDESGLLLYRSNLLGSDLRITNFGGGNTSAKIDLPDPLTGKPVSVLWVKGSGGDLGSMKLDGFATLYMDKLESLKSLYRSLEQEDEMVHKLNHCTYNANPRAASIDTCLHGYVPHRHVDHVHSDAVIAIAASEDSEKLTHEVFGKEIGYLPWQRPGIDLGIKLGEMAKANPNYVGVVLGSHGLFTWGPDSKSCYETTLRIINKAAEWLERKRAKPSFGGETVAGLSDTSRREAAVRLMPEIRGHIARDEHKVGHFTDAPEVLEFANSKQLTELAPLGTSCPDHFLRTKIRLSQGLHSLLRSLQASQLAGDARSQSGHLPRAGRRDDFLCTRQGDRTYRIRVLRERDQRHARCLGCFEISGVGGAGSVQHRVLASRGSQASAHAQA
jgi:rhamnose utilization protein RhaD (predicted bifunctional aldolase and dehydrogenase)